MATLFGSRLIRCLFPAIFCCTPQFSGWSEPLWENVTGSVAPSIRITAGFAFDLERGEAVLFGGGVYYGFWDQLGDTWTWKEGVWSQRFPEVHPSPRRSHAMAYDSYRKRVVLYGGALDMEGSNGSSETWEWDGANWINISPVIHPSATMDCRMVFDEARRECVLFGGFVANVGENNETWTWNGTQWTHRTPSTSPPAREYPAMGYDPARARAVLFGGYRDAVGWVSDTWEWNGVNWQARSSATTPSPRAGHAMAYSAALGGVFYFGGRQSEDNNLKPDDYWVWNGSDWRQLFFEEGPGWRSAPMMCEDASKGRVISFGGVNDQTDTLTTAMIQSDTWLLREDNGAGVPHISAVEPYVLLRNATSSVAISGENTHFGALSDASFGPQTLVSNVIAYNTSVLAADVSVSYDAIQGPRDIVVQTGDETVVGKGMAVVSDNVNVWSPGGLRAASGADAIFLQWEPVTAISLAGYNVYRDTVADGAYATTLNAEPIVGTSFVDTSVERGITYHYRVTALSHEGDESNKSDSAMTEAGTITVTLPDIRCETASRVFLPICIKAAWGVSMEGAAFHVTYDPAFLTPIAVHRTALTAGNLPTLSDNVGSASGQVDVVLHGSGTLDGAGAIFEIEFEAASGLSEGATCELSYAGVSLFDISGVPLNVDSMDAAIFTVSGNYTAGDVNGDGASRIDDAILTERIASDEVEPTQQQETAADVNGDGQVDSADAVLVMQMSQAQPKSRIYPNDEVLFTPESAPRSSYLVTVGGGAGGPGDTLYLPVRLDSADGVQGCELAVSFDRTKLELQDVILASGNSFALEWSAIPGMLKIVCASTSELLSASGNLCMATVRIREGARAGSASLAVAGVKLSGVSGGDLAWGNEVSGTAETLTVIVGGEGEEEGEGEGGQEGELVQPPHTLFSAMPLSGVAPLSVQFTDLSSAGSFPIVGWLWDFGDYQTSHVQNPLHIYRRAGVYTVALAVTSAQGADLLPPSPSVEIKTNYITVTTRAVESGEEGEGEGTGNKKVLVCSAGETSEEESTGDMVLLGILLFLTAACSVYRRSERDILTM